MTLLNNLTTVATALEKEVESYLVENEPAPANASHMASDLAEDFFSDILPQNDCRSTATVRAKQLVQAYLEQGSGDVGQLLKGEKIWLDIFIKFNTTIPSSAAVERLFSVGKDIFRDKRSSLTDENFERLMFIRENHHLENFFVSE